MALQTIVFRVEHPQIAHKTDRRAEARHPSERDMNCQTAVSLSKSDRGTTWLGRVLDVSVTGIGFSTSRRFLSGTVLVIDVSDEAGQISRRLLARVVHARPKSKMRWIIGCEFTCPLSEQELQDILGE
jgi:PilZ domain